MTMRYFIIACVFSMTGCKEVDCGDGTIERNGKCEKADVTIDPAKCGPNTMAVGDECLPMFPPTVCDPTTTDEDVDTSTNVTTCIGSGGGGCGSPIACPAPSAGKQTICGQLYTIDNNENFEAAVATGRCDPTMPEATGPCALRMNAYDAIMFANNPGTAPLEVADTYIDSCGRFRLTDISPPTGTPFIAIGIDDIQGAPGPGGVTNATGIAVPNAPDTATKDTEAFIVPAAVTTKWATTGAGAPTIAGGLYVMIFRQKRAPSRLTQAGVTVLKGIPPNFAPTPSTDYYFKSTDVQRENVDNATPMNVTGANGTALVTPASLTDGAFTGLPTGILPPECRWSAHAAQTVAGIVFVQVVRPVNNGTATCPL
jgi:hypothetical protein